MTLLSWEYGDPLEVVARREAAEVRRERLAKERLEARRRERYGLVSDATVRRINQARVREAVALVLRRAR